MGAVTPETCRVVLQWIIICILLHLLDFYSHRFISIYKAIQITWCSKRARLRHGRFLPHDCKIPVSFPVTEIWSAILRGKDKYHVLLDKLHWSKKILSHEEKCLFLMYFWKLNSNMFPEFLYHLHISRCIRLCENTSLHMWVTGRL